MTNNNKTNSLFLVVAVASLLVLGAQCNFFPQGAVETNNLQKFKFPRAPTSCSPPSNNLDKTISYTTDIIGWFFDGQSCQPNSSAYCTQDSNSPSYRGCDDCIPGFDFIPNSATLNDGQKVTTCQVCPTLETSGYLPNIYPDTQMSSFDAVGNPEVSKCKIFTSNDQNGQWDAINGAFGTTNGLNGNRWIKGMRATACGKNVPGQVTFQLYGSICWYIKGCMKYNLWGQCDKCYSGYFQTSDHICKPCKATCATDYKSDYKACGAGDVGAQGCAECASENTCSKCADGFWMDSPEFFDYSNDASIIKRTTRSSLTLLDDQSWCVPCPANCYCSALSTDQDIPITDINFFSFPAAQRPGYYLNLRLGYCPACNDAVAGIIGCATCQYVNINGDQQATAFLRCDSCQATVIGVSPPQYYYETPIVNSDTNTYTCKTCPKNCGACTLTDGETSCKPFSCYNGYRPVEGTTSTNKETYTYCVPCTKSNAARCETVGNKESVTQCQTENGDAASGFDTANGSYGIPIPKMNFNPPNTGDYLLVYNTSTYENECIKNVNYCKQIGPVDNGKNNLCKSCYSDQGYFLTAAKTCQQCGVSNCSACSAEDQQSCSTCASGYLPIVILQKTKCFSCSQSSNCKECTANDTNTGIKCTACNQGYQINDQGNCVKCNVQNCADCSTSLDVCNSCLERFTLWTQETQGSGSATDEDVAQVQRNIVCETCEVGCLVCNGNRKICTKCADNYYLMGETCQTAQANCIKWDPSNNKCQYCQNGYRITADGRCMTCFSPKLGVINCPTVCDDQTNPQCWYSTVNQVGYTVAPTNPDQ